ncbi:unnamed protein product [Kuraishia capsulata CBS 1993]|uniref:Mitochondrial carrier protein RIM2 n=1 Tax=Kuraishia capsulata CBS 1993 TaxID=1382522 RepID=W6MI67_9ASCO|nr:uncharacterized protein KUCA_T00001533001 [Kuraishia capsulata CBS 1993]CDK25563.1 unnamed protein product [Kuraishia capsulata CBS 1993]
MTIERDIEESIPYLVSDEKSAEFKHQEPTTPDTVKPWVHFVAGGIGGMAGAVCTSPFDVVKTRLQSSVYRDLYMSQNTQGNFITKGLGHFRETITILRDVRKVEGSRALFKGLGPNLVGVIPARSINFFTYGYGKDVLVEKFFDGKENSVVHLLAGINAGFVTSTATNPIWLVKTRLQLDRATKREYKNSLDCIAKIMRNEGITAFYRGLTASYLGSVESTLQWVLYEQMKSIINNRAEKLKQSGRERTAMDSFFDWSARSGAAGAAKFVASMITYPHEVVRTRLRQAPTENGKAKYTGLIQCFKLIIKEEGLASMYGGLTPHLMRTVPNSVIMFGTWEVFTTLLS